MCLQVDDAQQSAKMGWQQFLNNTEIPFEKRLHGAQVAFLTSSVQLCTQEKEDVVIQWLTRLVKEKHDGMWRDEAAEEQKRVWQLLAVVFTSKRIQALAQCGWTCPITSVFPQNIINVLGSPNLDNETQHCIIETVYSMLCTPTIAPIITNSGSLSLNLTTALLDIVSSCDWKKVAHSFTKAETTVQYDDKDFRQTWVKKMKVDDNQENEDMDEDVVDDDNCKDFIHEERVLHSLALLLDVVIPQMLAQNSDEAMTLCAHKLLKRVAAAKIASDPFNGKVKKQVMKQLDSLIRSCLFNTKVFPQYELFLEQLMLEDSKVNNEQTAVHILLSMVSDIVANETIPNVKCVVSMFFIAFLDKCTKDKHRIMMLNMLLYLVNIVVPGDMVIDSNSLAMSFIHQYDVSSDHREAVTSCLVKVLRTSNKSLETDAMRDFLQSLLIHLMDTKIESGEGFNTYHCVLSMYPVAFADKLPSFLGHLITSTKSSEEAEVAYKNVLLQLLRCYSKMQQLSIWLTKFMEAIVLSKDKLESHQNILPTPVTYPNRKGKQHLLLPKEVLRELTIAVRSLEPIQFCSLMDTLLTVLQESVLPLICSEAEGGGAAVSGCCWVVECVMWAVATQKVVRVHGYSARLATMLSTYLVKLLQPALAALVQNKQGSGLCCGVLMLCNGWCRLLYQLLHSNAQFKDAWQKQSFGAGNNSSSSSLCPYTPEDLWPQLQQQLHESNDSIARIKLIELWLKKVNFLHLEQSFRAYLQPPPAASTITGVAHKKNNKKDKQHKPTSISKNTNDSDSLLKFVQILSTGTEGTGFAVASCRMGIDLSKGLANLVQEWSSEMVEVLVKQLPALLTATTDASHSRTLARIIMQGYADANTESVSDVEKEGSFEGESGGDVGSDSDKCIKHLGAALIADGDLSVLYPQIIALVLEELVETVDITECITIKYSKKRKRKSMESDADENKNVKVDKSPVRCLLQTICKDVLSFNEQNKCENIADKSSRKCGQTLTDIISALNACDQIKFISYMDKTKVKNLLQLLVDLPLHGLCSELQVYIVLYFLTYIFNTDFTDEKIDEIISLMLKITNKCLSPEQQRNFTKFVDLPIVINRLISEQMRLPVDALVVNRFCNFRIPVVEQTNRSLRFLLQSLIFKSTKVDGANEVSSFIVSSAKEAATQNGREAEEKFLRPAWILVLVCSQYLQTKEPVDNRQYWCRKTISSIGSWCMKVLHKIEMRMVEPNTAAYMLSIYKALVEVETNKDTVTKEKYRETTQTHGETKQTNSAPDGNLETPAASFTNGWADVESTQLRTNKGLDDTLNTTVEGGECGKAKRWQRYLLRGVELAKLCLDCDLPILHSAAMCFIISTKRMPLHLQQQLPADMFRFALQFFARAPLNTQKYVEAYKQLDDEQLTNITFVKPEEMIDPVTDNPISLAMFLADCPVDVYQALLNDLMARSVKLEDGLFPHTASIWTIIIKTQVEPLQTKAKRASLGVLTRTLVWHLSLPSSSHAATDAAVVAVGHKASVMVCLLELFNTVIRWPALLPHLTVTQVISAITANTRHLSLYHFNKVWKCQVSLLEHALLMRLNTWADRVAGLLAALQHLVEELVLRSDQNDGAATDNAELLTGCCLGVERLIRKLTPLRSELEHVIHFTVGALITALHRTTVIVPVKNVLDEQIYHLFRLCTSDTLEHLLVALPEETRPMLQHYYTNYRKYYAYKKYRE